MNYPNGHSNAVHCTNTPKEWLFSAWSNERNKKVSFTVQADSVFEAQQLFKKQLAEAKKKHAKQVYEEIGDWGEDGRQQADKIANIEVNMHPHKIRLVR